MLIYIHSQRNNSKIYTIFPAQMLKKLTSGDTKLDLRTFPESLGYFERIPEAAQAELKRIHKVDALFEKLKVSVKLP